MIKVKIKRFPMPKARMPKKPQFPVKIPAITKAITNGKLRKVTNL